MDSNQYELVFANKAYFAKFYPMNYKIKDGYTLKMFFQDFGVPQKPIFDGSKKKPCKGTTFVKEFHRQGIHYHISEHDLHNQNPVEGVVKEVRRKWYHTMVKKRVPKQLWDYGVIWVSEVMSMTHYSENSVNGGIALTKMNGKTVDISKYLDFSFYLKLWFKDNAGLSPSEPGRWYGISHQTGRLICYQRLTQTGKGVSNATVQ